MRNGDYSRSNNLNGENKETIKNKRAKSTTKQKIWLVIWIIIFLFICYEVLKLVNYTLGKEDKENMWLYNSVDSVVQKVIKKKKGSVEEKTLTWAALGDIYLTQNTLKGAKIADGYDFATGTEQIKDLLSKYDLVTASLSTPVAGKQLGYSTAKEYNAPDELLTFLKELNVSVLATATSNAMDKNITGINNTIEGIKNAQIEQTGLGSAERSKPIIFTKNDISVGILSYATKSSVKIAKGNENYLNLLEDDNIAEDIKYLKENNVDFIVSYINVPNTDSEIIISEQKESVEKLIQAGVDIILCTGINGVQEDYEEEVSLEDGSKNHVYAVYAMGEFMGSYATDASQASIITNIEFTKTITKDKDGQVIKTKNDMKIKSPTILWTSVDKNYSTNIYIAKDEIEKYNNSNSKLTVKEYSIMKEYYDNILKMFE